MPYLRDDNIGPAGYALQDFAPTAGQSLGAVVDETFAGNPTSVGFSLVEMQRANDTKADRLTAYDAEAIIKESGVRGLTVKDGEYNREALDLLIERKRQEGIRADVMGRTEYSWTGTPVRGLAMLGASVIDPLNIASAFVPVIGQARTANLLGRTAAGSLARAGVRARIGLTEGAAGAAMLEPLIYGGRTQLQDDYDMSDSLLNLGFGTALGGGLHVAGGQVADAFRATDPYARFSGLDVGQVRAVLDFEKSRTPNTDIDALTADWTPKMREAAGFGERVGTTMDEAMPEAPSLSREDFAQLYEQYPRDLVQSIVDRAAARDGIDLPFTKLSDTTPEGANRIAARELADTLRAELLADAGNRAEKGDIAALRDELASVTEESRVNEGRFKTLAKQLQTEGLSRKQAEAQARKEISDANQDLSARSQAIEQQIETNRRATKAEQDIAALRKGEIPEQFNQRVQDRANQIMARVDAIRSLQPSARSLVESTTPEVRQAALRSAIAQSVNGRIPEVDLLVRGNPTLDQLKAVANRQGNADSLAIGDPAASSAAAARLKQAGDDSLQSAESELTKAMDRINQLKENLELGGMDQARTAELMAELRPFDDAVKMADSIGNAARAAAVCGLRG